MSHLLITGGAGFIGSHACLSFLEDGHQLTVLDNFTNSSPVALERVLIIAGERASKDQLKLFNCDIRDAAMLDYIFSLSSDNNEPIEAVVHFAGLKAVGESIKFPLKYWDVNVCGTRNLVEAMERAGCFTLVFSSSATLYGYPKMVPIKESADICPINPYGRSKAAAEQLLDDVAISNPNKWKIASLRYFNPVGAHPSGLIGEDPLGIPNNLFPFISQVAVKRRNILRVFGNNWPTKDGTCIRDYIHVMDLAEGHRAALNTLIAEEPQTIKINLGGGVGNSVLEVIDAFENASGCKINFKIAERRAGDAAITVADTSLAEARLGWKTRFDLNDMCKDGWKWQSQNPNGYQQI